MAGVFDLEMAKAAKNEAGKSLYDTLAEISMILERPVKEAKSVYVTGTIGKVGVIPNVLNVIPGRVHFTIDIRNTDDGFTGEILAALREEMKRIERERDVLIRMETINRDVPVHCKDSMLDLLAAICKPRGVDGL